MSFRVAMATLMAIIVATTVFVMRLVVMALLAAIVVMAGTLCSLSKWKVCSQGFRFLARMTPDELTLAHDSHQREQAVWERLRAGGGSSGVTDSVTDKRK